MAPLSIVAKRRNAITTQFVAHEIGMIESYAFRVMSLAAHRVLARIEIELARHGGCDNGKLPVTFDNFVEYGITRKTIAPAIAELVALGFIEVTFKGKKALGASYRRPNMFLLTTRPELDGVGVRRCRWRQFGSLEEARHVADMAREIEAAKSKAASAKRKPMGRIPQCQKGTTMKGKKGTTIYISGLRGEGQGTATDCRPPDGEITGTVAWTDPPDTIAMVGDVERANERLAHAPLADAVPQGNA
jgi:hypothetical protein